MRVTLFSVTAIAAVVLSACGSSGDAASSSADAGSSSASESAPESAPESESGAPAEPSGESSESAEEPATTESDAPGPKEKVTYIMDYNQSAVGAVAAAKGFYAAAGLEVENPVLATGSESIQAMIGGSAEFVTSADARLAQSAEKGLPIKAIALHGTGYLGFVVVPAGDTTSKTMEDLKGKRVAAQVGSGVYTVWLRYLSAIGLSPDDFDLVNMKVDAMPAAFGSDSIDAALMWNPLKGKVVSDGLVRDLLTPDDMSGPSGSIYPFYLETTEDIINNRPETVQKFVDAWTCSKAWIAENPDEAAEILQSTVQNNIDIDTVKTLLASVDFSTYSTITDDLVQDTEAQAAELVKLGGMNAVPDISAYIDNSFVEAAVQKTCPAPAN